MSEVAGFVETPFDAELAAGLASLTLARMLTDRVEQDSAVRGGVVAGIKGRVTLLTGKSDMSYRLKRP